VVTVPVTVIGEELKNIESEAKSLKQLYNSLNKENPPGEVFIGDLEDGLIKIDSSIAKIRNAAGIIKAKFWK
jgi:hypothetical protein